MNTKIKNFAKSRLRPSVYNKTKNIFIAGNNITSDAAALLRGWHFVAAKEIPRYALHFVGGLGDDLLCTAVAREFVRRGKGPIWIVSDNDEIFTRHGDITRVLPTSIDVARFAKRWKFDYRRLAYTRSIGSDRDQSPARHIIAELCARAGIVGTVILRPYLQLTEQECQFGAWARDCIVIQSSGLGGKYPIRNKEWYPSRFQRVVELLRDTYTFIQLGSSADPPLNHVIDLRGRTRIREAGSVLHHARAYIGGVGFLMHLARAVECPSVIIFGGRESPGQSGYPCNVNLYTSISCAPCWQWSNCDYNRQCMDAITAEAVIVGIKQILDRPKGLLATATAEI